MCGLQRSSWVSPQWCLVSSVLVRRRRPSHGDGDWCSVTGCDVRSGRRGALGRDERSALADERTGCRRRGSSQTGDRFAAAPIEPVGAADPGDEPWNKSHRRSDVRGLVVDGHDLDDLQPTTGPFPVIAPPAASVPSLFTFSPESCGPTHPYYIAVRGGPNNQGSGGRSQRIRGHCRPATGCRRRGRTPPPRRPSPSPAPTNASFRPRAPRRADPRRTRRPAVRHAVRPAGRLTRCRTAVPATPRAGCDQGPKTLAPRALSARRKAPRCPRHLQLRSRIARGR